jgi:hypothetical protein
MVQVGKEAIMTETHNEKLSSYAGPGVVSELGIPIRAFERTASGAPRHPLYLKKTAELSEFSNP